MRDYESRFDRAIDSIEKFLETKNTSSIVLPLYKGDKVRLERRYPSLTFQLLENQNGQQPYNYLVKK